MIAIPVIAIDGPSGSGKGTVSRRLAEQLGWHFLDSGALYRLVAVAAAYEGLSPDRPEHIEAAAAKARAMQVVFEQSQDRERVLMEGADVTSAVRAETTGDAASRFAREPAIREALLERQRAFRKPPGLVADGRDMGTVVFPDATVKFFLTATAEERARRRTEQLKGMGHGAKIDKIFSEIAARDERDQQRQYSPLTAAPDAVVIDTSAMPIKAVLKKILEVIERKGLITR